MKLLFETTVEQSLENVRAGFTQELFEALNPPGMKAQVLRFDGCKKGDEVHLELQSFFGKKDPWVSIITEEKSTPHEWHFVDEGRVLPWPLKTWRHTHRVVKENEKESRIIDDIHYTCGPAFMGPLISPALWLAFAVRPFRYRQFFRKQT